MFALKHRKYKLFPLVNWRAVPGLSRLSKTLCVQGLCAFLLPYAKKEKLFRGPVSLVAPYGAILRYYRCDTPYRAIFLAGRLALPRNGAIPPLGVQYPTKRSTKEFCDTIAAKIARYENYRHWASKPVRAALARPGFRGGSRPNKFLWSCFPGSHRSFWGEPGGTFLF